MATIVPIHQRNHKSLGEFHFSNFNLALIMAMAAALSPFEDCSTTLGGEQYVTGSIGLCMMRGLAMTHLEPLKNGTAPINFPAELRLTADFYCQNHINCESNG